MRERDVLDALHARLCKVDQLGSRRYVVAEHVGLEPLFPRRVLDLVAMDMWGSSGYALDGFEVKVSRADLLRELRQPDKAARFAAHLDTFTLALASDVNWRDLDIPPEYGVLVVFADGRAKYAHKPSRLRPLATYGTADPIVRPVAAGFARAAQKTAIRVCSAHVS